MKPKSVIVQKSVYASWERAKRLAQCGENGKNTYDHWNNHVDGHSDHCTNPHQDSHIDYS